MNKDKEPKTDILSEIFLAQGRLKSFDHHLEKAEDALSRGAIEQADVHFKRVERALMESFTNIISPNLTEEENQLLLGLQKRKFKMHSDGTVTTFTLNPQSEANLARLLSKAFGENKK
jgi:hypothetical protein